MSGLRRGARGDKKRACPPQQSVTTGCRPCSNDGSRRFHLGTRRGHAGEQGCRDGGRGDAGSRFNNPKSLCRLFCDPLPLLHQTQLCLIASSSSLVMCPWLVNGGQHPLPGELGLSPSSPRLLQGWSPFSAAPRR